MSVNRQEPWPGWHARKDGFIGYFGGRLEHYDGTPRVRDGEELEPLLMVHVDELSEGDVFYLAPCETVTYTCRQIIAQAHRYDAADRENPIKQNAYTVVVATDSTGTDQTIVFDAGRRVHTVTGERFVYRAPANA